MKKILLIYGILGGLLIAALKMIEYRFLVLEHSLEIYGGIIALIFSGLGIWLGLKLTRTRESEEAVAKKKAELDRYTEMYNNPLINSAITFLEPLPVALIVALASAGVLSRRKKNGGTEGLASGARVSV